MSMKLFLISQDENNCYDTYDSAVVCAPDEDSARMISPDYGKFGWGAWASSPENVEVQFIGYAVEGVEQGVVVASFNAG